MCSINITPKQGTRIATHRLVMFGSLRAGTVAAWILEYGSRYARFMGFIWFGIDANPRDGSLVARNRFGYKWFCLVTRLILSSASVLLRVSLLMELNDHSLIMFLWIRLTCCLICCIIILIMQFWCAQRILRVINDFLRLFRRVRALPGCQDMAFGGKRELTLLIFTLICLLYEILCELPLFFSKFDLRFNLEILIDIYTFTNASLISHSCFVGFLSLGALYDQMNRYVRHELRRQLRSLEQPNAAAKATDRRELKSAAYRLDECLSIYDEIQRVGNSFLRLMDLPICLTLLILFLSLTLVSYQIMCSNFRIVGLWLLVVKIFFDVVLLTLAVHGASTSSRVIRRLSLENCYVCERNDWNMKVGERETLDYVTTFSSSFFIAAGNVPKSPELLRVSCASLGSLRNIQ